MDILHPLQKLVNLQIETQNDSLHQIVSILIEYANQQPLSETFKQIYEQLFNNVCQNYNQRRDDIKEKLLQMKDIVWLLPVLKKYSHIFVFEASDLNKIQNSTSLFYAIKKMLRMNGEHLDFYENGNVFRRYHMLQGEYDGDCTHYYKSGKTKFVATYDGGVVTHTQAFEEF